MSLLTSRRTYAALGVFEAGDAVASAIPIPYVARTMDRLGIRPAVRRLIPVAKAAVAFGLLSVFRFPRLARLTTGAVAGYFTVALTLRIRARDRAVDIVPSALLLAVFAGMAARGPDSG